jgi:beta-lactam-binding protein with PASTA domain
MVDFFKFLTRRVFYKHIAIYMLVLILIIALASISINYYTGHGVKIVMPDLRGKTMKEVEAISLKYGFELQVVDSIYVPGHKKGTVVDHTPKAGVNIKKNRVIFLTLTSFNPEIIKMPDMVNSTLRQAKTVLETYGLELGTLHYKPDYAENYVLEQMYNGHKIKAGTKIQKGSKVDLVLGLGIGDGTTAEVPNLVGLSYKEALSMISSSMLNVGATVFDGQVRSYSDSLDVVVWKQDPPFGNGKQLMPGSIIDIWLKKQAHTSNSSEETNDIENE